MLGEKKGGSMYELNDHAHVHSEVQKDHNTMLTSLGQVIM